MTAGDPVSSLFQVNTRVRLSELSVELGRPATLDDIPDAELDRLAADGFDLVWFLGVWQTGQAARGLAVQSRVAGRVPARPPGLPRGRRLRLLLRGPRLSRPRGFRRRRGPRPAPRAPEAPRPAPRPRLRPEPHGAGPSLGRPSTPTSSSRGRRSSWPRSRRTTAASRPRPAARILAYGRDPYFAGWPDTLQLNYGNPALQEAMLGELRGSRGSATASAATWRCSSCPTSSRGPGGSPPPVLARATAAVRARSRASCSWPRSTGTSSGRSSSRASTTPTTSGSTTAWRSARRGPCASTSTPGLDFQDHLARFLENHDEPRAAADVSARRPPRRRGDHLLHSRPSLLPPGPARGEARPHPGASGPRTGRAARPRGSPPSTTPSSVA